MRNPVRSNPRGRKQSSLSYSAEQAKRLTDICTKKPYSCRICHKSFQTHSILAEHSASDHPQQQHEYHHHYSSLVNVSPIPRQRETTASLKTPSSTLGGYTASVLGYPCPICQRIFASVHDRDAHQRTSHSQRQTAAQSSMQVDKDICDTYLPGNVASSSTTAAKSKRGHQNKHNNSTVSSDNVSKKSSTTKTLRPATPLSSASSSSKPFQCEVCTRTFSRLSHLTAHEQIHLEVKKFKCSECGKDFLRAASLSEHQRAHAEQK